MLIAPFCVLSPFFHLTLESAPFILRCEEPSRRERLYRNQRGDVAIQPRHTYALLGLELVVRALKLVRRVWRGEGIRVGR